MPFTFSGENDEIHLGSLTGFTFHSSFRGHILTHTFNWTEKMVQLSDMRHRTAVANTILKTCSVAAKIPQLFSNTSAQSLKMIKNELKGIYYISKLINQNIFTLLLKLISLEFWLLLHVFVEEKYSKFHIFCGVGLSNHDVRNESYNVFIRSIFYYISLVDAYSTQNIETRTYIRVGLC